MRSGDGFFFLFGCFLWLLFKPCLVYLEAMISNSFRLCFGFTYICFAFASFTLELESTVILSFLHL